MSRASLKITPRAFRPLTRLRPQDKLWEAWLGTEDVLPGLPSAAKGQSILADPAQETSPPWPRELVAGLLKDVELLGWSAMNGESVRNHLQALADHGRPVYVTGQQPGVGGGPLYTLYKIATTIARARRDSRTGHRVVPVYWMGDDDDDLAEAFSSSLFHPSEGEPRPAPRTPRPGTGRTPMVGTLSVAETEMMTLEILEGTSGELAADFAAILRQAMEEGADLSSLQMGLLWRFFEGEGLVIVRGNDPRLHRAAEPFYRQVRQDLPGLRQKVREGRELVRDRFGIEGLADNSINRPLYVTEGDRRRPLGDDETVEDFGTMRCGVMLRSALQDWLFRPRAGIIGPGELHYLAQLLPLYQSLGLDRSVLLPRLFAQILPEDHPREIFEEVVEGQPLSSPLAEGMAREIAEPSRSLLEQQLVAMGVEHERARQLAEGRTRRWLKGMRTLLQDESRRTLEERRRTVPGWWFPGGGRQERSLAWVTLAAHLGPGFRSALEDAAPDDLSEILLLCAHTLPGTWKED